MMTIIMIDVEAGKEDLFDRIYKKYESFKNDYIFKKNKMLYLSRCFTHSDVNMMFEVKDYEALPRVFNEFLLDMEGVWDCQVIQLFNPNFFKIPKYVDLEKWGRFTVTLDVKSNKTGEVFKTVRDLAATDEAAITFLAYTFYSYDNDLIFSLLAQDVASAGKFLDEKIRTIDGVVDTELWELQKWKFAIPHEDWVKYINYYREGDLTDEDIIDDAFICGC